jgi:DNA-binding transcriptional LysR family regulator
VSAKRIWAFGYQIPPDRRLRALVRVPVRLGAVLRGGHPLAARPALSLADCVGYPMVLPDRSLVIGTLLQDALEHAAIDAGRQTETNSLEFLRYAATVGDTIAFLNEFEARASAIPDLVFLPLRGPAALSQELALIARRAGGLDGAQARVAEELQQILLPRGNGGG